MPFRPGRFAWIADQQNTESDRLPFLGLLARYELNDAGPYI
jgi:hypothetical protein